MAIVQRKCRICDGWHYTDRWPHNCMPGIPLARSDLPAPAVITDRLPGGVNGLYHHGVNRAFDSKSEYRKATKAAGYIEMGNDRPWERRSVNQLIESNERELERDVAETVQEMVEKGITV